MRLQPCSRQILARMFGAEADVGVGGEMNHQLRTLHRLCQTFPVKQIRLMETELRMGHGTFQKPPLPGRHVVEPDDAVARGKKAVYHMTGDKPSRTRD